MPRHQIRPKHEKQIQASRVSRKRLVQNWSTPILFFTISFLLIFTLAKNIIFLMESDSPLTQAQRNLQTEPKNPAAHLIIAQTALSANQYGLAIKEAQIAATGQKPISENIITAAARLRDEPDSVRGQINFWNNIDKAYPNSRDTKISLAINYWRLFQNTIAQEYIAEALTLDPNNQKTMEIEEIIRQNAN